ncbi:MAG TPA: sulfocyanin-like copper-binding protein, partial [Candidatus Nanopelagicaceae bacterium]
PTNLTGHIIDVAVGDMGMTRMMGGDAPRGGHMRLTAIPSTFAAGKVTIVVTNMGWRTHELVVLPLAVDQSAGQRIPGSDGKVDETGSLGEASNSCGAGTGNGITAGSVGWTTLTLAPGRYEFVCNLKNHYANGMYQEVVVNS